jgi:hypothetical protein
MAIKFNPDYILTKLYEFDERLGGRLKEEEKEREKLDPFYLEQEEIMKFMNEMKKNQAERNKVRLNEGRNHKMMTLDTAILDAMANVEKRIDDLTKILREQAKAGKSKEEITKKEEAIEGLKKMVVNLKDREKDAKNIKSVKDIAKESGVDIRTIDMQGLQRAEQRNLTKDEKAFLERVQKENEEIDAIMAEADKAMDTLIQGIDEIGEGLDAQSKQVKRLDKKIDKLEANLDKTNKKLKEMVGKFRSATNVVMDIVLIIILMIMIGVLLKVMRADGKT